MISLHLGVSCRACAVCGVCCRVLVVSASSEASAGPNRSSDGDWYCLPIHQSPIAFVGGLAAGLLLLEGELLLARELLALVGRLLGLDDLVAEGVELVLLVGVEAISRTSLF